MNVPEEGASPSSEGIGGPEGQALLLGDMSPTSRANNKEQDAAEYPCLPSVLRGGAAWIVAGWVVPPTVRCWGAGCSLLTLLAATWGGFLESGGESHQSPGSSSLVLLLGSPLVPHRRAGPPPCICETHSGPASLASAPTFTQPALFMPVLLQQLPNSSPSVGCVPSQSSSGRAVGLFCVNQATPTPEHHLSPVPHFTWPNLTRPQLFLCKEPR